MSYVKSEKWGGTNWNISRQEVVCLPERARCLQTRVLTLYNAVRLFFLIICAHGSLAVICVLQTSTSLMAASGAASIRVQECFPPSFLSLCFLKGAIRWSLSWPKTALKFPFKQHAVKPVRLGLLDLSEARALAACRRPWCPWPAILSGWPLSWLLTP